MRKMNGAAKRFLILALAASAAVLAPAAVAQQARGTVESGITDWQAGRYEAAVRAWRPLAEGGDADAQFNLGHAFRLGRGIPQDIRAAESWYARAAEAGHVEAQSMYGLLLFQNGRRREAMPYVRRAAERGDARAQYVYGTALFNGDEVPRDNALAWAYMSRAAAQGLPYARTQLAQMETHVSEGDRRRATTLAATIGTGAPAAGNVSVGTNPRPTAPPARTTTASPRISSPPPPTTRPTPAPPLRAPAVTAAAGGRWRVQLGAFSTEAGARSAWAGLRARLPGLQPYFVRAGAVVRLQAGPLASRAAASTACTAARQACFPVSS